MASEPSSPGSRVRRIFDWAMILVYAGAGALLVFTDVLGAIIPVNRVAIGCILLGYSAFRIYLTLKARKKGN
ncbi:MAG: hypothetical protein AB1458_07450 [Bacteroidota bacterium]